MTTLVQHRENNNILVLAGEVDCVRKPFAQCPVYGLETLRMRPWMFRYSFQRSVNFLDERTS